MEETYLHHQVAGPIEAEAEHMSLGDGSEPQHGLLDDKQANDSTED